MAPRHTTLGRRLWTSDRPVAETCTWQHKTLTRDKTSMLPTEFEPAIPARQRPQTHALKDPTHSKLQCSLAVKKKKKLHEKLNWVCVGFPEWTAQFSVWKTTGKDSPEACAIACQNCAGYSVCPSGMTSHSKTAQFNWVCIASFRQRGPWGWHPCCISVIILLLPGDGYGR